MYLPQTTKLFRDRRDAGQQLAQKLLSYQGSKPLVLALPRGGVPVAYEIARVLNAPLDVILAHKLGAPMQPELAFGAIAEGGVTVLNDALVAELGLPQSVIDRVEDAEQSAIENRLQQFRNGLPLPDVADRTVILVDDGLATGMTAWAAIKALRKACPQRIILAVPVRSASPSPELVREVDEIVSVAMPESFYAVGAWYEDFEQTTDAEVLRLLQQRRNELNTYSQSLSREG